MRMTRHQSRAQGSRLYEEIRCDPRVACIFCRPPNWVVVLNHGWCRDPAGPEHTITARVLTEAARQLRAVRTCDCAECRGEDQ